MRKILYLSGLLLFFSSCGWLNPSIMLKTGKNYQFSKNIDSTSTTNYKISPNDYLQIKIYSNDGFKLIDITSLNTSATGLGTAMSATNQAIYNVESDGNVKLPILGRKKLSGLTLKEAEIMLEGMYADYYVKPFADIKVTNRRIIVFPGEPGAAKVIQIDNDNTTLLEGLALAGGISYDGKARVVKLIRNVNGKQAVYLVNLATIQGLQLGSTVLQANDIIYVEPRRRYGVKLLTEVAPIVSLLTSTFILYTYSRTISSLTK
ncbi:MAG: polysaccharide biosynthesis/export family protein [Bacteroidota bacterium]